jgi:hypothetical protein
MSSESSSRKGFGALLSRIFGSGAATPPPPPPPPVEREPLPPPPRVAPTPEILVPRKGVGTVLRKAVNPDGKPHEEPSAIWVGNAEPTPKPRTFVPRTFLNLPRTVLSMLRKKPPVAPAPDPAQVPVAEPMKPEPDPALTRRKERDYPII